MSIAFDKKDYRNFEEITLTGKHAIPKSELLNDYIGVVETKSQDELQYERMMEDKLKHLKKDVPKPFIIELLIELQDLARANAVELLDSCDPFQLARFLSRHCDVWDKMF